MNEFIKSLGQSKDPAAGFALAMVSRLENQYGLTVESDVFLETLAMMMAAELSGENPVGIDWMDWSLQPSPVIITSGLNAISANNQNYYTDAAFMSMIAAGQVGTASTIPDPNVTAVNFSYGSTEFFAADLIAGGANGKWIHRVPALSATAWGTFGVLETDKKLDLKGTVSFKNQCSDLFSYKTEDVGTDGIFLLLHSRLGRNQTIENTLAPPVAGSPRVSSSKITTDVSDSARLIRPVASSTVDTDVMTDGTLANASLRLYTLYGHLGSVNAALYSMMAMNLLATLAKVGSGSNFQLRTMASKASDRLLQEVKVAVTGAEAAK